MPSDGRTDWYLGGLVVGTALVSFLLGATATLWLGLAAAPGAAAAQMAAAPMAGSSARTTAAPAPNEAVPGRQPPTRSASGARAASAAAPAAIPAPADTAGPPVTAAPAGSAAAAAATADGTATPAGDFGLQFGAFLDSANAKSLLNQLTARGYKAASVEVPDGDGQIWHYIRLGGFADERTAAAAASAMLYQTGIGAAVIRLSAANAGG